jgi:hypothetical protein
VRATVELNGMQLFVCVCVVCRPKMSRWSVRELWYDVMWVGIEKKLVVEVRVLSKLYVRTKLT